MVQISEVEPSTLGVNITDGSGSRAKPSTLRANIADGSGIRERTVRGGGRFHGRFGVKSGTVHAGGLNRGWCGYQGSNHPRWESISRKVRGQERNLPRWGHESRKVRGLWGEPSTLEVDIADGSGIRRRTFHAEGMNRGWFKYQRANRPRWRSISWKVRGPERNRPR